MLPSTPRHRPIGNGIGTDEPQVSFWVEKAESPECAAIDGSAKPKPKQSGRKTSWLVRLNSCRKKRFPYSACRISDSGDGTFTSAALIHEPASRQRPAATNFCSVDQASGWYSLNHM